MVQRVLTAPLDAAGALTLQQIAPERRLIELEFYYPLAELTAAGLQQVLAAHGFAADLQQEIGLLTFAPARGYMKGFIDLVFEADGRFYLVDYKSNWLGNTIAAYGAAALRQVMARETYFLQYIIYTLALHRYLRLRVPDYDYDSHLGGVFYLFLRGMDPDFPHYGIFRDRPPRQLVQALDAYLETGVPGR
jgi:exodeoxyribonuclease V beta subunit